MARWPQVDVISKVDGDSSGIQGEHNSQNLNEKLKGAAYDGTVCETQRQQVCTGLTDHFPALPLKSY